jgi:thiol-disulfide isomerase/thioredoxin
MTILSKPPSCRRRFRLLCLAFALVVSVLCATNRSAASDPGPRLFTAKSAEEIRHANAGRAYVLAFWSIHCEPCKAELALFADVQRKFPKIPIILVAADAPNARPAVLRFLRDYKLGNIETWQFADDYVERLRYSVDKTWHGELPRAYFFDANHQSIAQSGVVDPKWLEAWLAEQANAVRQ